MLTRLVSCGGDLESAGVGGPGPAARVAKPGQRDPIPGSWKRRPEAPVPQGFVGSNPTSRTILSTFPADVDERFLGNGRKYSFEDGFNLGLHGRTGAVIGGFEWGSDCLPSGFSVLLCQARNV